MSKKIFLIVLVLTIFSVSSIFAVNKAGTDKLGAYVGWPFGLSYSHNFTKVDQIDFQFGFGYGFFGYGGGIDIYLGYLRTVYEPVVGGVVCPLEVGCGIGLQPSFFGLAKGNSSFNFGASIYFDLRWEVFFKDVPHFNLFLDFAPGVYLNFTGFGAGYAQRSGIGLRYQF